MLVWKPVTAAPPLQARVLLTPGRVVLGGGRSDRKRPDANRPGHEPHETAGKGLLKGTTEEDLFPGRVQHHHPAGVVDVPRAIAVTGSDCSVEGIPPGTAKSSVVASRPAVRVNNC